MRPTTFILSDMQGLHSVDASAYLFKEKRYVPVSGQIDTSNIDWIITQCTFLIEEDETAPITLFFNSPGGVLDDAYRLIDYIDGSETPFIGVATQ